MSKPKVKPPPPNLFAVRDPRRWSGAVIARLWL
jgi:hypothetical protein